jgi:hypothetical protein
MDLETAAPEAIADGIVSALQDARSLRTSSKTVPLAQPR